ncbi:hypothetical protein L7F22_022297 [Adiantum nelumboides]|nr:hypothetical protein [Adiantum nelumboides]
MMDEFDDTDRFVELQDCGHVFEVSGLDTWMHTEQSGSGTNGISPKQWENFDAYLGLGTALCLQIRYKEGIHFFQLIVQHSLLKSAVKEIDDGKASWGNPFLPKKMEQVRILIAKTTVCQPPIYCEAEKKLAISALVQWAKPAFKGEGPNIEQDAEAWIEVMDDYFLAVGTAPENQAMLGMLRLSRDTKLWWKRHCRANPTSSPFWEKMKQAVKKRYLPLAHQALKMNEFYALRQLGLTLEEYYSKFVSLRRYAPSTSTEQLIAQFCQGLNRPLSTHLEAMRPTSIQDALIRAKPLAMEVSPFPRAYNQFNSF